MAQQRQVRQDRSNAFFTTDGGDRMAQASNQDPLSKEQVYAGKKISEV